MEERIKMNKRKIVSTIAAAMMVTILSTASVLAETQTEKPTYSGKTVTCVLSCDFSLFGNDKGTAVTSWGGKKKYKVRTMIFSRPDSSIAFKMMDDATAEKSARVSGSKKGVWEFKSQHYVVNSNSKRKNVCVITDW